MDNPDQQQSTQVPAPMMLAATEILRQRGTRVGKIGKNLTLPRTVPLVNLVAGAIGFSFGATIGLMLPMDATRVAYAGVFGAMIAIFFVTYSPLRGESFARWFAIRVAVRSRKTFIVDGKPVRVAIGVCPLPTLARGRVQVASSGVFVDPDAYDERGARRTAGNRNLDVAWAEGGDELPDGDAVHGVDLDDRRRAFTAFRPSSRRRRGGGEHGPDLGS